MLDNQKMLMMLMSVYVCLNNFRKNQKNETNIFSRKRSSLIKDGKL